MSSVIKASSKQSEILGDSEFIVTDSGLVKNIIPDRNTDSTAAEKSDLGTSNVSDQLVSSNGKTPFQWKGFCQRVWKVLSQRFSSSSSIETAEEIAEATEVDSEASVPSDSTPSISTTASSSPDPLQDVRNSLPRKGWKIEQDSSSESMQDTSTTSTGTDVSDSELNGLINGVSND